MDPENRENEQPVPPKVILPKPKVPPQAVPGAQKNLETMHIELSEGDTDTPPPPPPPPPAQRPTPTAVRPTVIVKPMPVAPEPGGERHQTMQINADDLGASAPPPAPAPARPSGPTQSPTVSVKPIIGITGVPTAPAAKRETSRIPLELAKPALGAPGRPPAGPSTIRVKPVVIRQTVDLAQAVPDGTGALVVPTAPAAANEAGKRKTSRISLESVLSGQPASASQTAEITPPEVDEEPRTIRIKRSAERPASRPVAVTPAPVAAPISPGQTARLELPPETPAVAPGEGGTQTPTRKKTIKVRRPGAEEGEEEQGAPAAVARPEPVAHATEDMPHVTFGVFAVLAVLVVAVLVWVLMAQTFGPDLSLTRLSYGWPECDLPWYNKIPILRQ